MSQLEAPTAVAEHVNVVPAVGRGEVDGVTTDRRDLDVVGSFLARQPERVRGIRVDVMDGGGQPFASAQVDDPTLVRSWAEGGHMMLEVTDDIPLGDFEMVTTLVVVEIDDEEEEEEDVDYDGAEVIVEVAIDRQSFSTY